MVALQIRKTYTFVKKKSREACRMRKVYLDNIRWITVVLVVVYHVIYMYNGVETVGVVGPFAAVQYQDVYQYLVYPWFMLLLFTVSGMAARFYLERHTDRDFLRARTTKLLVPSTIGLLVFHWILGYYNMALSGAVEQMAAVPKPVLFLIMVLSGTGPLWYIQILWIFSLLLVLVRKIEKDRFYEKCGRTNTGILLVLTVVLIFSAKVLNAPVVVVYRFGIYGAGFFIGYFCLSHDEVMNRLEKCWPFLTAASVILAVLFTILNFGKPYAEHVVLDTPSCSAYAWIATLAILAFMKKWGGFETSFSKWMSRKSWGLYIFHYLPLAAAAYYLNRYAKGLPALLVYFLTALAAFMGAYLLNEIISRLPFFRWAVLGIRRKHVRG